MKKLALTFLLAASHLANAQEIAQVLSRTALYQQVAVPKQVCVSAMAAEQSPGQPPLNTNTCTTQNFIENRLVGFSVVYEYAGQQHTVQLPQDPGPTLQVHITPAAPAQAAAPAPIVTLPAPTVLAPPVVVYTPVPVHRHYAPVYTHLHLGWGLRHGQFRGHRPGHWR